MAQTYSGGFGLKFSGRFSFVLSIDCIVYAICLVGLWQVAEKADIPFTVAKLGNESFRVVGVAPSAKGIISRNDVVRAFRGMAIGSLENLEFLLDGMRVGNSLPVEIRRGKNFFHLDVRLVHAYSASYVAVAWLIGTLFFGTGILVYVRRRNDVAAFVYHYGAVAVAAVVMSTWGCYSIEPVGTGQFTRIFFSTAYAFVPALFLHFSLVFPTTKKNVLAGKVWFLYVVASLLSVLMAVTFIKATGPFSIWWFGSFMAVFNVTRWFYACCVVLAVTMFVMSYRDAREEMERRKLRWIILGLAISSLGFISLWQIPQLLTSRGLVSEELVVLLSGATPVAFTVAIVRYHIMDIDHLLNRSTVYVMLIIILMSVYALAVGLVAAFVGHLTVMNSIIASAAAAFGVVVIFEPVRKKVQLFVDKNFFRVRYDLRRLEEEFDSELRKCVAVEEVGRLAVNSAASAIPVERIGYFVVTRDSGPLRLVAHNGFDRFESGSVRPESLNLGVDLSRPLAVEGKIESGVRFDRGDPEILDRMGISIVFSVRSEDGGIMSILALGPKKSGNRFSIEDVDLLSHIARGSGVSQEKILLRDRLEFELEERERLEELNRMKTYFVSSVSHDLKTPLTTIRMYTEALMDWRKLPASRVRGYLETIEGESKRLTRLIDNVLDVAKAERTKIAYELKPEELDGIVREAVTIMAYEAVKSECRVRSELTLRNGKILADRDAVVAALENSIANSLEYSKRGSGINVRTFSSYDMLAVSVKDSGIGIPENEMPKIFEPFFRGSSGASVRPGGTGLGLPVVKGVVEAHRGRIEIESEPGKGTCVTLFFPRMEEK